MLKHENDKEKQPSRVVLLGAAGFVGGAVLDLLKTEKISVLPLGRKEIDLLEDKARDELVNQIRSTDTLLVVSAQAPCKTIDMLYNNIKMMKNICDAIVYRKPGHVVYISSDAVYADSLEPLNEKSLTAPSSLHGIMHLAREFMLKDVCDNLAILRPTLIYGKKDPHNGYGPNRFRRLCEAGEAITLFGKGEERRDHVSIHDVASLVVKVILWKSTGVLNIATGRVVSFKDIAEKIVQYSGKEIEIKETPRIGEMPHNGYRAFDVRQTAVAFPDFEYTDFDEGIKALLK